MLEEHELPRDVDNSSGCILDKSTPNNELSVNNDDANESSDVSTQQTIKEGICSYLIY
jgi:hypothetical protein